MRPDPRNKLNESAEAALANLRAAASSVVLPTFDFVMPFDVADLVRGPFDSLRETIDRHSRERIPAYESLWSVGWLPDMHTPIYLIHKAATHVDEGRLDEAHEAMGGYYEGELDRIELSLQELHPERAAILSPALAAHRREEYVLSVPPLLAQSDGMAMDALRAGLYAAQGKAVAAAIRDSPMSSYVKRVGATLGKSGSIHAPREGFDPSDPLNRHDVLHGRSTTYGTQVKSLQAIALASFVGVDLVKSLREAEAELAVWRTSTEGLSAIGSHWEKGKRSSRAIVGTVVNSSTTAYRRVEVRVELWGEDGAFLGRAKAMTTEIQPGASLDFRVPFPNVADVHKALVKATVGF